MPRTLYGILMPQTFAIVLEDAFLQEVGYPLRMFFRNVGLYSVEAEKEYRNDDALLIPSRHVQFTDAINQTIRTILNQSPSEYSHVYINSTSKEVEFVGNYQPISPIPLTYFERGAYVEAFHH